MPHAFGTQRAMFHRRAVQVLPTPEERLEELRGKEWRVMSRWKSSGLVASGLFTLVLVVLPSVAWADHGHPRHCKGPCCAPPRAGHAHAAYRYSPAPARPTVTYYGAPRVCPPTHHAPQPPCYGCRLPAPNYSAFRGPAYGAPAYVVPGRGVPVYGGPVYVPDNGPHGGFSFAERGFRFSIGF